MNFVIGRRRELRLPVSSAREGILTIGNGVTVSKTPRETEPGYTIDTFTNAMQEEIPEESTERNIRCRP